jgi:hypothetical protein
LFADIVKCIALASLLLAVIFWNTATHYQLPLNLIVCIAAIIVSHQALRARAYAWAVALSGVAVVFNPIVPLFRPAGDLALTIVLFCSLPFAVALVVIRTPPLLAIPSIIVRDQRRESL